MDQTEEYISSEYGIDMKLDGKEYTINFSKCENVIKFGVAGFGFTSPN